ncbi:MAG TPA: sigma-54 dependent transcriptional regulator, partial [Vicinamibacterales bacterium]|nr:sigma-54 dependent transcriptional regulator [Vicinamibacterales bacterium]
LLEAAKALESQQKDQQRLGALWQPEIIIEEPGAVFSSPQMIELMTTARKVAATSLPVLLLGDTGTGKEVLARAIHRASTRPNKIFLPFNCSAVPRDMVESQLFGYRRGSFTGAHVDFPGIIRSAEGGTLFLDEIGELSMDLQPKLLRFLETNEVHPLGEGKPIKVDVRVIAATNADLDDLIQLKEFREDLYYRLNIVRFHMPQLSERREEIPPLATHLLRRFEMDEKKHGIKLSDELMEYLLLYKWPGNVRQLSNELRKMVAMVPSNETLTPEHLAPAIRATRRTVPVDPDAETAPAAPPEEAQPDATALTMNLDQPLPGAVEALERAMIEHAMTRADGRIEEAARLLGISRKGLFLKRRRWLDGGETPSRPA